MDEWSKFSECAIKAKSLDRLSGERGRVGGRGRGWVVMGGRHVISFCFRLFDVR